ncbi:MAG TPA: low affinity iron permease family protein [Stellaceae bacterium]|jgi:low affinity Fe/Cu permease|nr:low affinity iron permease family protein [Stellaceae bacterium]
MVALTRIVLTWLGVLTARPIAVFVVLIYAGLWFAFSRETMGWHAIVTLATWMMTVLIQRAEHRDTQAIHAKLDHLLEKLEPADARLAAVDKMQPEEIEEFRKKLGS